jgi:hypothetical protein
VELFFWQHSRGKRQCARQQESVYQEKMSDLTLAQASTAPHKNWCCGLLVANVWAGLACSPKNVMF